MNRSPSPVAASARDLPRRTDGTRETVELALLLLAAAVAYLLATSVPVPAQGAYILFALGGLLLGGALLRRWSLRRFQDGVVSASADSGDTAFEQARTLWRLRASVQDSPGRLAQLTAGLAAVGGNIRTVHVHPTPDGAVDEVLVHMPDQVGARQLVRAVTAAGGRDVSAAKADVRQLDDLPTRALSLATALVTGDGELVHVLRGLLGTVDIRWHENQDAELGEVRENTMWVRAPGGGVLKLTRAATSFTPAEFARARTLADLAEHSRARLGRAEARVRVAGTELVVRTADRDDLALVTDFHDRCSRSSRYQRYFGPGPWQGGLSRLLTPALGRTLAVLEPGGQMIAMGNLMYGENTGEGDTGELALLVRDDWQRRGVGTMLAKKLVGEADALGLRSLHAHTQIDNAVIARILREAGLKLDGVPEPGEWSWRRPVVSERGRSRL